MVFQKLEDTCYLRSHALEPEKPTMHASKGSLAQPTPWLPIDNKICNLSVYVKNQTCNLASSKHLRPCHLYFDSCGAAGGCHEELILCIWESAWTLSYSPGNQQRLSNLLALRLYQEADRACVEHTPDCPGDLTGCCMWHGCGFERDTGRSQALTPLVASLPGLLFLPCQGAPFGLSGIRCSLLP